MKFSILSTSLFLSFVLSINGQNRKYDKELEKPVYELLFTTYKNQKEVSDFNFSHYVNLGLNLGFEVESNSNGGAFQERLTENRILKLTKTMNGSSDLPGVPSYPIGVINVSFLVGKDDTRIYKVITEVKLLEYSNVSNQKIMAFFNKLTDLYNYWSKSLYQDIEEETIFDYMDFYDQFSENYPIISKRNLQFTIYEDGESYVFPAFSFTGKSSRDIADGNKIHSLLIMKSSVLEEIVYNDVINKIQQMNNTKSIITEQLVINGSNIEDINTYNIRSMIDWFIQDARRFGIDFGMQNITSKFNSLEGTTIAVSKGFGVDGEVIVVVDPDKWEESSLYKKWYIIYHELGHDLLNLSHGEGGKMMFNYTKDDYSMEEFIQDREEMFTLYFQNR